MTYPAAPEPADTETVLTLALDNPLPRELRDQIDNWIEPQTMNTYTDHGEAMTCVEIAYPLIRAWLAEHPEAT
jgi:hypothetical protein